MIREIYKVFYERNRSPVRIRATPFIIFAFLAPKFLLFHFGALDSPLAHLLVVLNFGIGELTVFLEYDVEAEPYNAEPYNEQCKQEQFHRLQKPLVLKSKRFLANVENRRNLGSLESSPSLEPYNFLNNIFVCTLSNHLLR